MQHYAIYNSHTDMWLASVNDDLERLWLPAIIKGTNVDFAKIVRKELGRILNQQVLIDKANYNFIILFPIVNGGIDYSNGMHIRALVEELRISGEAF